MGVEASDIYPLRCPLCRGAMVGETDEAVDGFGLHICPNCGTSIERRRPSTEGTDDDQQEE